MSISYTTPFGERRTGTYLGTPDSRIYYVRDDETQQIVAVPAARLR